MKRVHALLMHLYCIAGLGVVYHYITDQIAYQHAVIYLMRIQAQALVAIAAMGHST